MSKKPPFEIHPETGKYIVKLPKPVVYNEQNFEQLLVNPDPTCGDLAEMDKEESNVGKALALVAALSNVPLGVIKKSHSENIKVYSKVVETVMGESLETGGS